MEIATKKDDNAFRGTEQMRSGLTKREYFAAHSHIDISLDNHLYISKIIGRETHPSKPSYWEDQIEAFAIVKVKIADKIIEALNKNQ